MLEATEGLSYFFPVTQCTAAVRVTNHKENTVHVLTIHSAPLGFSDHRIYNKQTNKQTKQQQQKRNVEEY